MTDTQGRELEAEIIDYADGVLEIRRTDGQSFKFPMDKLSADSNELVFKWMKDQKFPVFLPEDIEKYPFEIKFSKTEKEYAESDAKMVILGTRGTKPQFEEGGEYLMIGEFDCPNFEEEYLFFGVENGNDQDSGGYSRFHRPKEEVTKFKTGLRIKGPGSALLGVFSDQKPKWRVVYYFDTK